MRFPLERLETLDQFAAILANALIRGDKLALTGDLGAGKTTFTQKLCQHLGVTELVSSPTFTLLNEYQGNVSETPFKIYHGDLYRLKPPELPTYLDEVAEMLEDSASVLLMEWANLAPELEDLWTWQLHFRLEADTESRSVEVLSTSSEKLHALKLQLDASNA